MACATTTGAATAGTRVSNRKNLSAAGTTGSVAGTTGAAAGTRAAAGTKGIDGDPKASDLYAQGGAACIFVQGRRQREKDSGGDRSMCESHNDPRVWAAARARHNIGTMPLCRFHNMPFPFTLLPSGDRMMAPAPSMEVAYDGTLSGTGPTHLLYTISPVVRSK